MANWTHSALANLACPGKLRGTSLHGSHPGVGSSLTQCVWWRSIWSAPRLHLHSWAGRRSMYEYSAFQTLMGTCVPPCLGWSLVAAITLQILAASWSNPRRQRKDEPVSALNEPGRVMECHCYLINADSCKANVSAATGWLGSCTSPRRPAPGQDLHLGAQLGHFSLMERYPIDTSRFREVSIVIRTRLVQRRLTQSRLDLCA